MSIRIRKGKIDDVDAIVSCYDAARQYMRAQGNTSQWVNGYPSRELILDDIRENRSFVATDDSGEIVMVFSFVIGPDPTYSIIMDGEWLNDNVYGTIHRIGSTGKHNNMLNSCVEFCRTMVKDIRLDTHNDNQTMRNAAERLGFKRCGTIICCDGTPRIAYHLAGD